jgi:hypothetical protein
MKVKDLIELLETFNGDEEVTLIVDGQQGKINSVTDRIGDMKRDDLCVITDN